MFEIILYAFFSYMIYLKIEYSAIILNLTSVYNREQQMEKKLFIALIISKTHV